jgi:SAM-dependent methyltransferase
VAAVRSGVFGDDLAANYDESRHLGEESVRNLTEVLVAELLGRGAVLEIGVGTGRVALPLARAGIPMLGVDPSSAMLRRLLQKGEDRPPFGLLRGDALALPFADATLGATLFCHVLHLIPDWQGALREAARVLRPGGALMMEGAGTGEQRRGVERELRRHFRKSLRFAPPPAIGVRDEGLVATTLQEMGWRGRELTPVVATQNLTLGALIDRMERGISSSELSIPPADRRRGWAETRRWAAAELGPLEHTVEVRRTLVWQVFEGVS